MANSSFERDLTNNEEKESLANKRNNASISNDCAKDKDHTIDEKFCGTDDINSDGSLLFEVEKNREITRHLNIPGRILHPCISLLAD